MASIRSKIVQIGNSQGIRIPKALISQCGFDRTGVVEIRVENSSLIIEPVISIRAGWNEAFQRMNIEGEDRLLYDDSIETEWDKEEWVD